MLGHVCGSPVRGGCRHPTFENFIILKYNVNCEERKSHQSLNEVYFRTSVINEQKMI
jgi:hypothetical protein